MITSETQVEEIVENYPEAVKYFIIKGVTPFFCSGAYPANLGELLDRKKVQDKEGFIRGLNAFLEEQSGG
jgi:hypothetical protein